MVTRFPRVVSSLVLVLVLVGISTGTVLASGHLGPTTVYFPWVPNGEMLDGSGPYYGTVTIQNLEEEAILIYPTPLALLTVPEPPMLHARELGPHQSMTLSPSELGLNDEILGSGLTVRGTLVRNSLPARIAGVQKQAAPEPLVDGAQTGTSHNTVGGYGALINREVSRHVVLPIVQTNSGWNTIVRVTSFDLTATSNSVQVSLHEAGGMADPVVFTQTLGMGATGTFNLLELGVPPEWVGSAIITAEADIGAVAERVKPATSMLILNTSRNFVTATTSAPLILREWNYWNTGISIANIADEANHVTVTYYAVDGSVVDTDELEIPANGMSFIYTPAEVLPEEGQSPGFVGSATIEGQHEIFAAVDQVKYFGDDQDSGHAMSYMIEPGIEDFGPNRYLVLPLVQKGDPETGIGDTTGIQLFNPSPESSVDISIWFFSQNGTVVAEDPVTVTLEPYEGYTAYTMFYDFLPPGFQGSAIIRKVNGEVMAASNNVNYAVLWDGSASINLTRAWRLYGPTEMALSASPNPVDHLWHETTLTASLTNRFGDPVDRDFPVEFRIDNIDQTSLVFIPGDTGVIGGEVRTNQNGQASVGLRIVEEALGDRPVTTIVTAETGELEQQISVTWLPEPQVVQQDY